MPRGHVEFGPRSFSAANCRAKIVASQLMSETREWPRIAVVGAGAVGGYFGGMFASAGAPTVFIGRKHFADAVNSKGLFLDKSEGRERIRVKATVEMSAVRDCSLILLCVKANDTSATANQ